MSAERIPQVHVDQIQYIKVWDSLYLVVCRASYLYIQLHKMLTQQNDRCIVELLEKYLVDN